MNLDGIVFDLRVFRIRKLDSEKIQIFIITMLEMKVWKDDKNM